MKALQLTLYPALFLITFVSLTGCIKDDILHADVPNAVVDTWQANFPRATNPQWQYDKHLYQVEFAWNAERWWAEIDCDGHLRDSMRLGEIEPSGRSTTTTSDTDQPRLSSRNE